MSRHSPHSHATRDEVVSLTSQGLAPDVSGRAVRPPDGIAMRPVSPPCEREKHSRRTRAKRACACEAVASIKNSASRWRFRPPRPTGLPPRGCPLFVEPLGRGFDLVALRARCKGEGIGFTQTAQGAARRKNRAICGHVQSTPCLRRRCTASGRTTRSTHRRRNRLRRAARSTVRARATTTASSTAFRRRARRV